MNRVHTNQRKPRWSRAVVSALVLAGGALLPALSVTLRANAQPASMVPASVSPAQDTRTEDAFWKVCRDCHDPDRIRETRRTRGGWEEIIEKMIEKGALGTDQDFTFVLQYLMANYGMVNMNQALAEDIAVVTGLPAKDAEAIVAYRKEHGNFKNFEALVQVPGIDVKTLEAHRGAIMF